MVFFFLFGRAVSTILVRSNVLLLFLVVDVGDGFESVEGEDVLERESLDDRVDFADLAIERMLPVSGSRLDEGSKSRGADVGPGCRVAVGDELDPAVEKDRCRLEPLRENSPEPRWPFVYGRWGDDEAAEDGDVISGVDDRVLTSPFVSSLCDMPVRGVDISDVIGLAGLLYTAAGLKVLGFE